MSRVTKWADKLTDFILSRKHTSFEWGKHDCCLFAADAGKVITGVDYAAAYRGRYNTELGAARALKRYGKGTLIDTLNHELGAPAPRLHARRGDVVLVTVDGRDTAGVLFGDAVVPGEYGLVTVSPLSIRCVWRMG